MTIPRRSIESSLTGILAAAVTFAVFSPVVAAVLGTGSSWALLFADLRHAGPPLARSVGMAATAAVMAMAIGCPFAIAVDRAGVVVRRLAWAMAAGALIVPPYVVAESAIVLLGPTGKVSRAASLLIGFGPPAGDALARARYAVPGWVYTVSCAGAVIGGCLFPIVAASVASANRRTDRRVIEAARLIRGRPGVWCVAARLLAPPAIGAGLLVFALALAEPVVPQLLRVPSMGEAIYTQIQEGDLAGAAALGLLLSPVILLAGAAGTLILARSRSASLAGLEGDVPNFTGGRGGRAASLLGISTASVSILPAIVLPAVSLVWLALTADRPAAAAGGHRVLRASGFADALTGAWELTHGDAVRTVVLATLTASVAVTLAAGLAWPLVRTRWAWFLGGLGAGLAVPAPVAGLGLIVLWNRPAGAFIYQSPAVVVLAWMGRFLPVTVLLSLGTLARVPPELVDAAAVAGRGPMRRFLSVVLPAAAPGLTSAWAATYVLCATEFVATLLVAPPGFPLLAPSVVNLIRRGQDPEIAAVQVLLLAVVAGPVLLIVTAGWLVHRGRR